MFAVFVFMRTICHQNDVTKMANKGVVVFTEQVVTRLHFVEAAHKLLGKVVLMLKCCVFGLPS